ncbi:hypothetical protein IGS68_22560 [Skermanella sp. TT6]|uniref:Uncharacterized protein n=1 Tax=Skermanella cutis TaxID=2775420 RepID=A0ABX7B3L4_9PROT|nr:hypothetical protein [Skermanella sp. TT6]QQP88767.1 hypothetical protein IGS68_22560 [Skermanella sp. TT6]
MNHIEIKVMGRLANPSPGDRVLALLSAYFDKSATEPVGVTSVAGYVAPLVEWERVEAEWAEHLAFWGLKRLHFSEIEQDLGREKGILCVKGFESIIAKSSIDAIGAALLDRDWHRDDWKRDETPKLSSPYEQCLDMVLKCLGKHTEERFPGADVAVFFDQDAAEDCILSVFRTAQINHPHLISANVGSSLRFLPIQCADLGAGMLRKSWLNIDSGNADDLPWGAMPRGGTIRTAFWSLRQEAAVARAMLIHLRNTRGIPDPS